MNFEQRCTIPVARGVLWQFLMDVPQMATCVPGVESVTASSDGQYAGRMRVKVGPIHLTLQGVLTIQERDQQQWRAVARAEANDRRIGGGVHLTAHMTLVESSPAATELAIQAQARLLGKLGEFGQPVIRRQADAIIAEFARNVAARFHSAAPASRAESSQGETPVAQSAELRREADTSRFSPVSGLIGAAAGLGLAGLTLTTLPTTPLISWPLVGIVTAEVTALGILVATGIRVLWKKSGQVK